MENYPFKKRIKEQLRSKGETNGWLIGEIGKSQRWVDGIISIEDVTVGMVETISTVLGFDFMREYSEWKAKKTKQVINLLNDPQSTYKNQEDITITINIRGNINQAGKILEVIKEETAKHGFKID